MRYRVMTEPSHTNVGQHWQPFSVQLETHDCIQCCLNRTPARGRRAFRESGPSPPAQAPESPYLPRFEAEVGDSEMRENNPEQPRHVVGACARTN